MTETVQDNPSLRRFELAVDGGIAFSQYRRADGVLTILHTEVPRALEGRGLGSRLVRGMLDLIRVEGAKVAVHCPFVRSYIERHPEYADLLA